MRVLVTGAGGFLGSRVVERLLAHGVNEVRCLVRDTSKASKLRTIAQSYSGAVVDIVAGNLKNSAEMRSAVAGVDVIVHCAAAMKGGAADMFLDSVVASRNMLDLVADREGLRIVLVSSFGVFGASSLRRGGVIDEKTQLEPHPELRDVYAHSKLEQEKLFWSYQERYGFELVVLRPGVIYGPGSGHFSGRVGLNLFGVFLHLGGSNVLPLTYVDNCAEAIAIASLSPDAAGEVFNVVDDQLLTSRQYLSRYKREVKKIRSIRVPFFALMQMSRMVQWYNRYSEGQLPAIFTPYKTRAMWAGHRFSNKKLHSIGWNPIVSTEAALQRTFASFRDAL